MENYKLTPDDRAYLAEIGIHIVEKVKSRNYEQKTKGKIQ